MFVDFLLKYTYIFIIILILLLFTVFFFYIVTIYVRKIYESNKKYLKIIKLSLVSNFC